MTFYLIGGIAVLLLAVIFIARKWGGAAAQKDFAEKGNEHAKEALEIDERVKHLSPDERRKWLYGDK